MFALLVACDAHLCAHHSSISSSWIREQENEEDYAIVATRSFIGGETTRLYKSCSQDDTTEMLAVASHAVK